ncbi:hypothetical protein RY831_03320 [Noviherbaspirillum sp. CPCC 100848]|uniref:HTH OST-type domain-containing protein n=1 Tax=Noviherbaspirillum album TaxID=3080276 RepID=A0ABU6J3F4_9BURK|nr:hypothetical protein [Noviherbaspirillum sp. CPCC 100848]MEC4718163.1 hypothetical protein [Noviherbaspirillum sp. CPCC 100848]
MTSDLKPLHDEVLRRIGRNLLLFQQIEALFKHVLATHKAEGEPENFQERLQKETTAINRSMMGSLVEKYGKEFLQDAGTDLTDEDRPVAWLSFKFHLVAETDVIVKLQRDMELMKDARNELVHGFLPRWQPDSKERLEDALSYLDQQRENAIPMLEHLRESARHLDEGRRLMLELISSGEHERLMELAWLKSSPLVELLQRVATSLPREDGWTYLALAGNVAMRDLPDEVKNIKERYGLAKFKGLLLASEMFEIRDETLPGGGTRTIYKNKSSS